jgi:hypothetical protein
MTRHHPTRFTVSFLLAGLGALSVLMTAALVAAASREVGPRSCSTVDRRQQRVLVRNGYYTRCGPASAVLTFERRSYAIRGGFCTDGRMSFGVSGAGSASHRGFAIILASNRSGGVPVIDGEVEFVPGIRVALSGTAIVRRGLKRGTFRVYGRSGTRPTGSKFTGSWNCG